MKVLFDMVHPADVHFFKHAIFSLKSEGHDVVVTSREKDVTIDLLDKYKIPHHPITKKGKGAIGLFLELIVRDIKLFILTFRKKPDVFVANNSPCSSHVAWLFRKSSIVYDDTEIHRLNRMLYYPFVSEVYTPECYRDTIGKKQIYYDSYHSLAYLHPNHFTPDKTVLTKNGISAEEPYVFIRLVSWGAMHDIGLTHLQHDEKLALVKNISKFAKVLISSEGDLDDELKQYQVNVPLEDIHHILAFADLVVAESATMCSEAIVLGTYSIYIDQEGRGYTDEMEEKYSLCKNFEPNDFHSINSAVTTFLEDSKNFIPEVKNNHQKMMADKLDLSNHQLEQIYRLFNDKI
jgi:predicted glycosyltransferase